MEELLGQAPELRGGAGPNAAGDAAEALGIDDADLLDAPSDVVATIRLLKQQFPPVRAR